MSYLDMSHNENALRRNKFSMYSHIISFDNRKLMSMVRQNKHHSNLDCINMFAQQSILKDHMLNNHFKIIQSKYRMNNDKLFL